MESKLLRPVKCGICKKQMYYVGDPEHEPEVTIIVYHSRGNVSHRGIWNPEYVHKKCWNGLGRKVNG